MTETLYDYRDENGQLIYQVVRIEKPGEKKKTLQRRPDPAGGWIWGLGSIERTLYRLPELLESPPTETVYVAEGEKCVEALRAVGLTATCNSGGATKWVADMSRHFARRNVVILPDHDEIGRRHSIMVARDAEPWCESVKIVELPGLADKGDIVDWFASGKTVEDLKHRAKATKPYVDTEDDGEIAFDRDAAPQSDSNARTLQSASKPATPKTKTPKSNVSQLVGESVQQRYEDIVRNLRKAKPQRDGGSIGCCPAHGDDSPSLSVKMQGDKILLKCHAGCSAEQVANALGYQMADLFERKPALPTDATWKSTSADEILAPKPDDRHDTTAASLGVPDCYAQTDLGNARRLIYYHGHEIRFVPSIGWHHWQGTHWTPDQTGQVMRYAKQTAEKVHEEAMPCRRYGRQKDVLRWAIQSESAAKLSSMLDVAKTEAAIVIAPHELDANQWTFNCANGTLDLRTGELRPHNPKDNLTRVSPVAFDPSMKCPIFDQFLRTTFADSQPLIDYMMAVLGHCLTGDISMQHMWVCYGGGANGKSTLLDTVQHLMDSYAGNAPDSLLMVGRDEHPTELASLQGKRLVIASETEANQRLKLQLIKKLTGDATITTRRMRMDFYEFQRTHKMLMMTNNKPRVRENSEATWRRLKLIPFAVQVPVENRDTHLAMKLRAEAAGILNRLLAGCLDWQRRGLVEPQEVTDATKEYRDESDPLEDWIEESCMEAANGWSATNQLYFNYVEHAKRSGEHPHTSKAFAEQLKKRGHSPEKSKGVRGWKGIVLTDKAKSEVDSGWQL